MSIKWNDDFIKLCKNIASFAIALTKQAKYYMGCMILHESNYQSRKYGDEYFKQLAKKINKKGWSARTLRYCVEFAELPYAKELLEDDKVTWKEIVNLHLKKCNRLQIPEGLIPIFEKLAGYDLEFEKELRNVVTGKWRKHREEHARDLIKAHILAKSTVKDYEGMRVAKEIWSEEAEHNVLNLRIKGNTFLNLVNFYRRDVDLGNTRLSFHEYVKLCLQSFIKLMSIITEESITYPVYESKAFKEKKLLV